MNASGSQRRCRTGKRQVLAGNRVADQRRRVVQASRRGKAEDAVADVGEGVAAGDVDAAHGPPR